MARRRYGRMRRAAGKATIPLLGVAAGAALGLSILARGNNGQFQYNGSPAGYLKEGAWPQAMSAAGKNLTDAGTYVPMLVPLALLIGLKLFHVKGRVSKKVSLA